MQITTKTKLIANDPCEMLNGSGPALIVGKEYPVKDILNCCIVIESEIDECHLFRFDELEYFFTIKTEQ